MTETSGHVAEIVGHDGPKSSTGHDRRNDRSRCRNGRSRWAEIRTLLTVLYSAKHNKPWGQGQKKLVEVAHRVAGAYKHHLTWFMHAVRKYERLESMQAEGDPSRWKRKYEECQAEYRTNRAVYAPRREHQAVVEFLFPELAPMP